jgi:hypothetical protein
MLFLSLDDWWDTADKPRRLKLLVFLPVCLWFTPKIRGVKDIVSEQTSYYQSNIHLFVLCLRHQLPTILLVVMGWVFAVEEKGQCMAGSDKEP